MASALRDYGYVLPLREFEEKLASKYAARELSPESKRTAVEKDYAQYVEAYKSDVRGPGGEAMRFFTHHSALKPQDIMDDLPEPFRVRFPRQFIKANDVRLTFENSNVLESIHQKL